MTGLYQILNYTKHLTLLCEVGSLLSLWIDEDTELQEGCPWLQGNEVRAVMSPVPSGSKASCSSPEPMLSV